eukprot:CAMPEP_0182839146 /NCGR_PEP_ID=MMETSP0006_2-20121128/23708_1 /TAXON_ID=97485 /ORGANISM="Prymnesium parvum, Strain Texoma1" /LENGTH=183 /DNA_ID=CAMNT_0024968271 /DNA_START=630 /DNA_END=1183 /DNA_ORIENTATION=+
MYMQSSTIIEGAATGGVRDISDRPAQETGPLKVCSSFAHPESDGMLGGALMLNSDLSLLAEGRPLGRGSILAPYSEARHSAGKVLASTFGQYPFTFPASSTRHATLLAIDASVDAAAPYATLTAREVSQRRGKVKPIADANAAFFSTGSLLTPMTATFFFSYSGSSSWKSFPSAVHPGVEARG